MRALWGKILAVPVMLACLGGAGYLLIHGPAVAPPTSTAIGQYVPPPPPARDVAALFVGDSYTAGAEGVTSRNTFACKTAEELGWICNLDAQGSTGYVSDGHILSKLNKPYPARLEATADTYRADWIIVSGGLNDGWQAVAQAKAARAYFRALHAAYPKARLVVLSPFWVDSNPPANIIHSRRGIKAAAEASDADWIDTAGWLTPDDIAPDHIHPTARGHEVLAEHLVSELRALAH